MKKSSSTPRKISNIKGLPSTSRKNSTPKEINMKRNPDLKAEDFLSYKLKNQIQSCRASQKPPMLKHQKSCFPQTARVSPKSNSTPLLQRTIKPNPYEIKQARPKTFKNLIRIKKITQKENKLSQKQIYKPTKNSLKELVTKIELNVYDFPDKLLTNKEIKSRHQEIHKAHLCQTFQGLQMITEIPKIELDEINEKIILLTKTQGLEHRKTVIFDLDETLVHCVESGKGEVDLEVSFPSGEKIMVAII